MEKAKLKKLLIDSRSIVEADRINRKEKGEDFNLFSILNMESNETKTHSAMIVALLDPKGSHHQGEIFLKCFLDQIGYPVDEEKLELVKVKAEHHLGKISKDYTKGGYIDILISFSSGKSIAIENKIYAKDQPKQMYRYNQYKGNLCQLYYLNLFGNKPSDNSLNGLTDEDYNIITYQNDILNWLEKCMFIVKHNTTLSHAIKQYQLLIKKITNTMDKTLEDKLKELIIRNLEGAKFIHNHYEKAVHSIREDFRKAVYKSLCEKLKDFDVSLGNDATHVYSQIWIGTMKLKNRGITFGMESFSGRGHNGGRIFIGLFHKGGEHEILRDSDRRLNAYWPVVYELKTPEGNHLNLVSTPTLELLINNKDYFEKMVSMVVSQVKEFIEKYQF